MSDAKLVKGKGYRRKGEKTQAKYLSGFKGKERKAREAEIVKRGKIYRKNPDDPRLDKPLPGDKKSGKPKRRSEYTVAYKKKYGEESGGSVSQIAKDTGIDRSIIDKVMRRGVAAAKSAGRRPGMDPKGWGIARAYAFVMKAKHNMKPLDHDHDLAIEAGLAKKEESMKSMRDQVDDTIEKLLQVDDFAKIDSERRQAQADRHKDMIEKALTFGAMSDPWMDTFTAKVEPESNPVQSIAQDLDEDENRSDSETAFFFDDPDLAIDVLDLALAMGLVEGEVLLDDSVDPQHGVGRYAVRLEPMVKWSKPAIYYAFLEELYDLVDERDLEDFDAYMSAYNEELQERMNPNHSADKGWFTSLQRIKDAGAGSRSNRPKEKKKKRWGGKGWRIMNKKCGRDARAIGKTTRCWDGKEGADFWR